MARREAELTRQQRRQLQRLSDEIDRLTDADRNFFKRRPERAHRIRRAFGAEIAASALMDQRSLDLPPHLAWFVAVKQLEPGARVRTFFVYAREIDTDLPEEVAAAVFEATLGGWTLEEGLKKSLNEGGLIAAVAVAGGVR